MNRLRGLRCYLAGPIDRCPNGGVHWRENMMPFLKDLGTIVFDPTKKPIEIGSEDIESRHYRLKLRQSGKFEELSKEMRKISNVDLRMIDICDFLIVHLDLEIYPAGTVWEMVIANLQKKPILLHFEQGVENIPDWYFARLPYQEFFSYWKDLCRYLVTIDSGHIDPGKRWYFFDKDNI
jgi:nucleoside 2-deoxyribosyltransferase